jgi:hypothetical protein
MLAQISWARPIVASASLASRTGAALANGHQDLRALPRPLACQRESASTATISAFG